MIKAISKPLPKELTSYDLLKALAIILMVIDHTGHHFYPDDMWFRVIGRLCLPIWFFLIGYAKTTEIPNKLWAGGIIVTMSAIFSGQYLLPLNILFTIIVLRIMRASVVLRCFYSADGMRGIFLILVFLTFPTAILFEYGSITMLFVLIGYALRNKDELAKDIDLQYIKIFAALSFLAFYILQGINLPHISEAQALFMFAGFTVIGFMLWNFRPAKYVDADRYIAPSIIKVIQFMGRRTLEIYIGHILIFRAVCMYLYPDQYGFFDWNYIPHSVISAFI